MRALVLSGRADGLDVPPALLIGDVVRSLRDAGHDVATDPGGASSTVSFDILITVGTVDAAPDTSRRIVWLAGTSKPGGGRWDRVIPSGALQALSLVGVFGDRVGPVVRPFIALAPLPNAGRCDRFFHCSPPWLGLHRLLDCWPVLWEHWKAPLSVVWDIRSWCQEHASRTDEIGSRARAIARGIEQPGIVIHRNRSESAMMYLATRSRAILVPHEPHAVHDMSLALPWLSCLADAGYPVVKSTGMLLSEWAPTALSVEGWNPQEWLAAVDSAVTPGGAPAGSHEVVRRAWSRIIDETVNSPAAEQPSETDRLPHDVPVWRPPALLP